MVALDRTVWRNHFGQGYRSVARQDEWTNLYVKYHYA